MKLFLPPGISSFSAPSLVLATANVDGVSPSALREDAQIAVFDAVAPVTQAVGDAAGVGVAAVAPRRDHRHGMPAFAVPAVALGAAAADGVATSLLRTDVTIAAFDATLPAAITEAAGGAVGVVARASRRDHAHPSPATWSPTAHGAGVHTDRTRRLFISVGMGNSPPGLIGTFPGQTAQVVIGAASDTVESFNLITPSDMVAGVPSAWVWFSALDAGAGDIVWVLNSLALTAGADPTAAGTTTTLTQAAPGATTLQRLAITFPISLSPDAMYRVAYGRNGSAAGDTYATTIRIYALELAYTADM